MTADEKLAAILAAIQTDPGNRGLAELFAACPGDFAAACRSIVGQVNPSINVDTGFYIPSGKPSAFETDGPLGAIFLFRALTHCLPEAEVGVSSLPACVEVLQIGAAAAGLECVHSRWTDEFIGPTAHLVRGQRDDRQTTHDIALEHVGQAGDEKYYTMRGLDITRFTRPVDTDYMSDPEIREYRTIGIGDGGNEIGMGKIPHETVVKNIPNGDLIHCRVPTDHLIVAGVSNWGAYALAAGVYVLRGVKAPAGLFDPERERAILEVMVREGPLVDGVSGEQTATVDGLTWDEYVKPLVRIREILEA
jgi:hypothetical protein